MRSILICLLILFVLGCNSSNKAHLTSMERQIIIDNTGAEDFNSFFNFFKQDTVFQFKRTSPPYVTKIELVQINAAGDLIDTICTSLNKDDWKPASWVSDITTKVELRNDSAILIYSDTISNREMISKYIFIRSDGKWRFKTLKIDCLRFPTSR